MKKILTFTLAAILAAGCGTSSPRHEMVIATSFYPMYLATANIAAGVPGVRVINLTKPTTGCLHDYQLTTEDLKMLSGAEVFVMNGGGMESFIEKVVAQLPRLIVVDASKDIALVTDPGGAGNPHVWVSVSGAIQQVKNIAEGLAAADPGHALLYRRNAAAYVAKLDALKSEMHSGLKGITHRDIITFHEAFPYFASEFGLNIAAVIEREPGSEPSAGELAATIRLVRRKNIKALFAEPQYPAKAAETIARETGAKVYSLDPVASGPMDDPNYYLTAMEKNLSVLQEALK